MNDPPFPTLPTALRELAKKQHIDVSIEDAERFLKEHGAGLIEKQSDKNDDKNNGVEISSPPAIKKEVGKLEKHGWVLHDSYTNKKITGFSFNNTVYEVSSYWALIVKLSEVIFGMRKEDFRAIVVKIGGRKPYFSDRSDSMNQPQIINGANMYIETCLNANQAVDVCRRLIKAFEFHESSLRIITR